MSAQRSSGAGFGPFAARRAQASWTPNAGRAHRRGEARALAHLRRQQLRPLAEQRARRIGGGRVPPALDAPATRRLPGVEVERVGVAVVVLVALVVELGGELAERDRRGGVELAPARQERTHDKRSMPGWSDRRRLCTFPP